MIVQNKYKNLYKNMVILDDIEVRGIDLRSLFPTNPCTMILSVCLSLSLSLCESLSHYSVDY